METQATSFVVVGAGAIGSFVGLLLDHVGFQVTFLQRQSQTAQAQQKALARTGLRGWCSTEPEFEMHIAAERIKGMLTMDPKCLTSCSYVLVATKRTANVAIAQQLAEAQVNCPVIFLQNGMNIKKDLGDVAFEVVEAVVSFNVVYDSDQGAVTLSEERDSAKIVLDGALASARQLAELLTDLPVAVQAADPILSVQAGKLQLNLTNAINALSGLAILPMFTQASYRAVLAACVAEAKAVFTKAGIRPIGLSRRDTSQLKFMHLLLRAPTWLFMLIVGRRLRGRGQGRTSMSQDLNARRVPTEIDFLNGEVVRLGEDVGIDCPVNRAVIKLVKEAEETNQGCPGVVGDVLMDLCHVSHCGCWHQRNKL